MKQETQTKELLLKEAKLEFMEKGYAAASLRNICKNANVTTGALYFFFKDKEDLFGSLVEKPLQQLYKIMKTHYDSEILDLEKGLTLTSNPKEDREAAVMAVDYIFRYYDEFKLLLLKANGSKYENQVDRFIEITEKHNRILADAMAETFQVERLDDYTIHSLTHIQICSFTQLITHEITRNDAMKQIELMIKFMIGGWFSMFKKD